jgi:hypothetical protein
MNGMLVNLLGDKDVKLSASHLANTKILLLDSPEEVTQKIMDAPWNSNDPSTNGVLGIEKTISISLSELRSRAGLLGVNGEVAKGVVSEASRAEVLVFGLMVRIVVLLLMRRLHRGL